MSRSRLQKTPAWLGSIPGSFTPGRNYLQSPFPLPRIPLTSRSSLFSSLTFPPLSPQQLQQLQQLQQPQQPQPVSNDINDVSTFEYIAMGLAGGIWIGANFVCQSIGSMLSYAASSFGYSQSTVSAAITRSSKSPKRGKRDHRHDPLGGRVRPRSPISPKTPRPLKSAMTPESRRPSAVPGTPVANDGDTPAGRGLLGVLPHHVGATPFHAHPKAGIAGMGGYLEATRGTHGNSQDVVMDADGDIQMGTFAPPILESPRPQLQASKVKTSKRVRFADLPEDPALGTSALVRKPPIGSEDSFDFREDFRKSFNQTKYKRWIDFLQSQGISVTEYRESLYNEMTLPTDVILRLYSQREKTPENWKTLVTCLSHDGFLERMGIAVPKYKYGPPPRSWEPDELPLHIPYDSPYQQRDGRCCFCRGFKWAGEVEIRNIAQYGDEVECRSQHRLAVPYTERELEDFRKGVFDSFWRRCCQESRWDWVFEEPVLNGPGEIEWQIPQWDVRLRHYRRFKNPLTGEAFGQGLFLPQKNLLLELYELQANLSRQDLAAKLFIDAVEVGNEELASDLRKMDKERKRKQVQTEFLCVRQVRLMVGESPTKVNNHNDMVKRFTQKKPEEDFDFLGLKTLASESPVPKKGSWEPLSQMDSTNGVQSAVPGGPQRDCDPKEPTISGSSLITDQEEEARRATAEWARFKIFKERHELRYGQRPVTHYALAGLDPEEFAARQHEYDQNLWNEFLTEEKCLQEENEQDERYRMKKLPQISQVEMPMSGWGRGGVAEKHGPTLEERMKQDAAIRHNAKEYRRLTELQRAREEQRSKLSPTFN